MINIPTTNSRGPHKIAVAFFQLIYTFLEIEEECFQYRAQFLLVVYSIERNQSNDHNGTKLRLYLKLFNEMIK